MAKKKTKKGKSTKVASGKVKKTVKKRKASTPHRRDFEVFARGVERLEELRVELNTLNTKGFELDVASISSKLKNVSYIPQIESEIKDLKAKIKGSYKKREVSDHKEIKSEVIKLKAAASRNTVIHRKIRELEKHIPDKDKLSRKIRAVQKEAELAKNVPKLQRQVNEFRNFINEKKREDARRKEMLRKLDPNVDFLINDKFNLSLSEIKAELAKQVSDKETNVEKQLQEDFETRRKNFERQYRIMERDLEAKYNKKLKDTLMKEVHTNFNKTLSKRVRNIKERLVRENNKRLEKERKMLMNVRDRRLDELRVARRKHDDAQKKFRENVDKKIADLRELRAKAEKERANLDEIYRRRLAKEKERLKLRSSRKLRNKSDMLKVTSSKRLREKEMANDRKVMMVIREERKIIEEMKKAKEKYVSARQKLAKDSKDKIEEIRKEKRNKLSKEVKELRESEKKKLEELEALKIALRKRKKDMDTSNVRWLRSVEAEMRAEERKKLARLVVSKTTELTKEMREKLAKETTDLRKHKQEEILVHRTILDRKMNRHLTDEVRKVHKRYNDRVRQHNQEISKIKNSLGKGKSVLAGMKDSLDIRARKIKNDEENYRKQVMSQLELEKQRAIDLAIKRKSREISGRLKKDFDNRLKLELKAKQAEFDKRKSELALEIQEKAKNLFV